jgi:hypothetical protein
MSAIRLAATMGALGLACAAAKPLAIVGLERAPGSECKFLAEVTGFHYAKDEDEARRRAWHDAQDLGATHVLKTKSYRTDGYAVTWEGRAYRCDSAGAATAK